MITFLILVVFVVIIIYIVGKVLQKTEATGNWSHIFPDLKNDPDTFGINLR